MTSPGDDFGDRPSRPIRWLLGVLLLVVAVPVGYGVFRLQWVVFREWREVTALQRPERVQQAIASVIDQRKDEGRDEVQYQFHVPGDSTTYSHADFTGRTNLWIPLLPGAKKSDSPDHEAAADLAESENAAAANERPSEIQPAESTGRESATPLISKPSPIGTSPARPRKTVEVVYLPENPWANQPAQRAGSPVGDTTTGLVFMVLICLVPEVSIAVAAAALVNDRFRRQLVFWWNTPASGSTATRPPVGGAVCCDRCRKLLDRYTEGFGGMMHQLEGVNCANCRQRLCNNCHPPSRGTSCSTCRGPLRPNFGTYMSEW